MSKFIPVLFSIVFVTFGALSCASDPKPEEEKTTTDSTAVASDEAMAQTPTKATTDRPYLLDSKGVEGVEIGRSLDKLTGRVKKGQVKNGEGVFDMHRFASKDDKILGYFLPNPENENLVGDIVITSNKVATAKGIGIGSTFAELKAAYPNAVVHGSEIESRTTATIGNMSFLLDAAFNTYEVDESQIKPDTKVKEIMIMRQAQK